VAYRSGINFFLYRSVEFSSDPLTEVGLRAGYVTRDGKYDIALIGSNVLDERALSGGIDFNNLSGYVNEPAFWGAEMRVSF